MPATLPRLTAESPADIPWLWLRIEGGPDAQAYPERTVGGWKTLSVPSTSPLGNPLMLGVGLEEPAQQPLGGGIIEVKILTANVLTLSAKYNSSGQSLLPEGLRAQGKAPLLQQQFKQQGVLAACLQETRSNLGKFVSQDWVRAAGGAEGAT